MASLTFSNTEFELVVQFYAALCDRGGVKAIESYNYGILFEKLRTELQKESKTTEESKTLTFSQQDLDVFLQFYSNICERGALKAIEAYNYGVIFEKIREQLQKAAAATKEEKKT